ncbi:hypothetical protein FGO68_gene1128 [Halteria grandinella]|uniref:Ankyrin repeat domain-containing protein n=1 Tax=Halteria grandinella TaxID=5974 RepID=A0A8J8NMT1_HALGN|nr:hypothetical protein FGO68_gene1128 [Halteria grandinella]
MQKDFNINKWISAKKLTPLYKGLRLGMPVELLHIMVNHNAYITYLTTTKRNAFHYAVRTGKIDLMTALLQMLDTQIEDPKKKLAVIQQVDEDEEGGFTPLGYAQEMGDSKMVELIEHYVGQLQ